MRYYLHSDDPVSGHTALLTGETGTPGSPGTAGYLLNPHIREFVINGGDSVYPGSVIVSITDGVWQTAKVY